MTLGTTSLESGEKSEHGPPGNTKDNSFIPTRNCSIAMHFREVSDMNLKTRQISQKSEKPLRNPENFCEELHINLAIS
jgi:hypothetical protein